MQGTGGVVPPNQNWAVLFDDPANLRRHTSAVHIYLRKKQIGKTN